MNSGTFHRISFERFRGTLFPESGKVEFMGMIFLNAHQAIQVLREISKHDVIKRGFMCMDMRGFQLEKGRIIVANSDGVVRFFGSRITARMAINALQR